MSAATEFAPELYIPAGPGSHGPRTATVLTLLRPSPASVAVPVRLTRRGVVALSAVVVALAVALISLAALSAQGTRPVRAQSPAAVTVRAGDTLWAIASRVAPDRDPRAVVVQLQRRNHLRGATLTPGQVLRTR